MPIDIVAAAPADAPLLTALAKEAKAHWGYPASWLDRWAGELTLSAQAVADHPTYVARDHLGPVGFYALRVEAESADLEHLWVAPRAMRQGHGRRLFEHAERTARSQGCTRLRILSDPHAEGFYCRLGATVVAHEDRPMAGISRRLPLLHKDLSGLA